MCIIISWGLSGVIKDSFCAWFLLYHEIGSTPDGDDIENNTLLQRNIIRKEFQATWTVYMAFLLSWLFSKGGIMVGPYEKNACFLYRLRH